LAVDKKGPVFDIINYVNYHAIPGRAVLMPRLDQDLAAQLFQLGPRIARTVRQTLKRIPGAGLTLAQYRILDHVACGMGKASDLSEMRGVSLPAMSRMVGTLVSKGFLERHSSERDHREIQLKLSGKGLKAHQSLKDAVLKQVSAKVATLPQGTQKDLESSLKNLIALFP
jgi:DNA-binding MarR family transcriptional regulator